MKHALLFLALVGMGTLGCQTPSHMSHQACQECGPSGRGQYAGSYAGRAGGCLAGRRNGYDPDYVPQIPPDYANATGPAGPPTAAVVYPYYTTRAPRDFLLDSPSTIGY